MMLLRSNLVMSVLFVVLFVILCLVWPHRYYLRGAASYLVIFIFLHLVATILRPVPGKYDKVSITEQLVKWTDATTFVTMTFDNKLVNFYTPGEYWILKSSTVSIPARYSPTRITSDLSVTKEMVLG